MSFEDSMLDEDDYFGCKDIYETRPSYMPKPHLVGGYPTYEQVDEYTKKLEVYKKNKDAIAAWELENQKVFDDRREEFFEYFCDYVDILPEHPKASLLFSKSWENGHSDGYSSVLDEGLDLVDLAR
jgi:hypothetical protein